MIIYFHKNIKKIFLIVFKHKDQLRIKTSKSLKMILILILMLIQNIMTAKKLSQLIKTIIIIVKK